MIALTPRLAAVAAFVSPGDVVADIGTDHAYVPAYLIEQGIIREAFACDIHEGPLANAKKTVADAALEGVTFLLSDGLQALEGKDFTTVIIAGMGGELIAHILQSAPWCRQSGFRFILQPMTKSEILRSYLYREGFVIQKESLVAEKDKLYSVLLVGFKGEKTLVSEAFALLGDAKESPLFEEKRQKELKRLQKIAHSLQHKAGALEEIQKIEALMKEIEVY